MPTRSGGAADADAATKNKQPSRVQPSDLMEVFIPCGRLCRPEWRI